MDCPKCGYAMTDFDVECPRCKWIAAERKEAEGLKQVARPTEQPPEEWAVEAAPVQTEGEEKTTSTAERVSPRNPSQTTPRTWESSPSTDRAIQTVSGVILFAVLVVMLISGINNWAERQGRDAAPTLGQPSPSAPAERSAPRTPVAAPPSSGQLTLGDWSFTRDGRWGRLRGQVRNDTSRTLQYVEISFNLYNSAGAQVGTTFDTTANLQSGVVWEFDALVAQESAVEARVTSLRER